MTIAGGWKKRPNGRVAKGSAKGLVRLAQAVRAEARAIARKMLANEVNWAHRQRHRHYAGKAFYAFALAAPRAAHKARGPPSTACRRRQMRRWIIASLQ